LQKIHTDYAYLSDDSNSFRGISQIAPEERKNSSEESNETSEESNDKSEEISLASVENKKYPPRNFEIPRWI
jgi:hypothetical protein